MSTQDQIFLQKLEPKFALLPYEDLIFAQRKHWLTFALPIAMMAIVGIIGMTALAFSFNYFADFSVQLFTFLIFLFIFLESLSLRSFIDWYFNVYILTTRRIIEISYSPLASHKINQVLLDQVRCTEIDTRIEGLLNDLLNIGHVIITFDRPTHQEELILEYVKDPRKIESFLQSVINKSSFSQNFSNAQAGFTPISLPLGIYNRSVRDNGKWTYMEELANLEKNKLWTT